MASLLTLSTAPYNPYNTSLAEIAMQGISLAQKEMDSRDRNAQQAVQNTMEMGKTMMAGIQQTVDNSMKSKEMDRLERSMAWSQKMDLAKNDLAERGLGLEGQRVDISRDSLTETTRQFDKMQPLRKQAADQSERRLEIDESREAREDETFNELGGREATALQNKLQPQLQAQALGIAAQQAEVQRSLLKAEELEKKTAMALLNDIDFESQLKNLDAEITSVDKAHSGFFDLLKLSDVGQQPQSFNELLNAAMGGAADRNPATGELKPGLAVPSSVTEARKAGRNTMMDIAPGAFLQLQEINAQHNVVQSIRGNARTQLSELLDRQRGDMPISEADKLSYYLTRKALTAADNALVEKKKQFDISKALTPVNPKPVDAAKAATGGKNQESSRNWD